MIDDIKKGLELAKGVVGLAKSIDELSKNNSNIELKEAASELRSKTIDLKEMVNDMRDEILDLNKKLTFNEDLKWNGKAFEYQKDGITAYICNGCKENGKFTHMSEKRNDLGYHAVSCPICDNKVTLNSGDSPRQSKRTRGGW